MRRKCSSGGAGFEIGKCLLGQGYKVCGVRYDAEKIEQSIISLPR